MALWDPLRVKIKAYKCFVGILLAGNIRGLGARVHILNIYDPYRDRVVFWASLTITGDLNCTIGLGEVWGRSRKVDPLARMIGNMIMEHNFVDICPSKMAPNWDNGRARVAYLAKRLDRFLMHEQLVAYLVDVNAEVISNFMSDHRIMEDNGYSLWHAF